MSAQFSSRIRQAWEATTRPDRAAILIAFIYGAVELLRASGRKLPSSGLFGFFFLLACAYAVFRLVVLVRRHLLWSLRNRLLVAYIFIAVVPILLLLTIGFISTSIVFSQLGAHVLNRDVQTRLSRLEGLADALMLASPAGGQDFPAAGVDDTRTTAAVSSLLTAHAKDLPGLAVRWQTGRELLPAAEQPGPAQSAGAADATGSANLRFTGLYQEGDKLFLRSVLARNPSRDAPVVTLSVPLGVELLERLAPQLGVIQVIVMGPVDESNTAPAKNEFRYKRDDRTFRSVARVSTIARNLPPPTRWWDREVTGFSSLEATALEMDGARQTRVPVLASFSARPSQLSSDLFSSMGDLSNLQFDFLLVIAALFLLLEAGALYVGVRMTQSITGSVADLYRATEHVKGGDFTYRIRSDRKDQLGELGKSFNAMTVSVASAISDQRRRERLENELAIAQEVQRQLFPRELPRLPGLELAALCRAAATVSGDYYDFIPLGKTELGFIIADIAGKGIAAALLMASLQAALRGQFLEKGSASRSTAEVVRRLNRHLVFASPEDRYATLFFAVYDSSSRVLRYTNAGHLPPFCFCNGSVTKLEEGGTVVGLFDECDYEQGEVTIAPGSLLMAYTDGLVEPENAYGEEFGLKRLMAEVLRHRQARLETIAGSVVGAVEDWAGTPERSDDMTIVLASVT